MSSFKPMVKMMTDEPSVILKLKKGGKVHHKHEKHEEHGHKSMHHAHGGSMHGAHEAFEAEHGHSPKKPSMAERRRAMNPNQYKKGGKVEHKALGGAMPMAAPMAPMARTAVAGMAPAARMARAAMVRKALTGMKKGGHAGMEKHIEKLEKELHHHESLDMAHAHHKKHGGKMHHKASGGEIDRAETKTTIEKGAKKFEHTKVDDGEHHDKHHGTKGIKDGAPAGYKHGGHAHKKHHKATGGAIPADTDEKVNKGKIKMHGTIEGNEHDYVNTEMHEAKRDKAHGTKGIKEQNAGGFKHGGKIHHKAHGGKTPGIGRAIEHDGDWENRPADGTPKGKVNGTTGGVRESNAGGYKHGGHAAKKHYATGGNVVDDGKAVKMPRHFVSRPVANSLQSGTFKKGGNVKKFETGGSPNDKYIVKNPEKVADKANRDIEEAMNPLSMAKELYGKAKNFFSPSAGSVTKTEKSVTVAPRKRGGSAKC